MRKVLAFLLLSVAMYAQTATVSGNLKKLSGDNGTLNTKLQMEVRTFINTTQSIRGCPAGFLRVVGTGVPIDDHFDFVPAGTGVISGSLYRTDFLDCGGATNAFYRAYIITLNEKKTYCDFYITSSTWNANSAACSNVVASAYVPTSVVTNPSASALQTISGPLDVTWLGVVLATPSTSGDTCAAGKIWADATYLYVCTATNTIKRVALSTF